MEALPFELLCCILEHISLRQRQRLALVSKAWAAAVSDARSLELAATPAMAAAGLTRILARFPRLTALT
eukprot:jgi/Hompol1/4466/HPOL_007121-RA